MTNEAFLNKLEPFTELVSTIFSPFMDTLAHRFWFALVMAGIFAVLCKIVYYSGKLLPYEFEVFHLRKHVHWRIFFILAGCVLIAGYYPDNDEAIYTIFGLLRNLAVEEWYLFSLGIFAILLITSLFRSLLYLKIGAGFAAAMRAWADRLFSFSCGMVLGTVLEYVGTIILSKQSMFLLIIYFIAQIFATAGAALWAIGWFGLSFFTEEWLGSLMQQKEQVERARRRTPSTSSGSGESYHSTMTMPGTIRDAYGNVYRVQSYGVSERTYYCPENGGTVTIRDSDISMSNSSARVGDELFQW